MVKKFKTNKAKAEKAIEQVYKYLGKEKPQFVWADSPRAGAHKAAEIANFTNKPTKQMITQQANNTGYGEPFGLRFSGIGEIDDIIKQVNEHCGLYWMFKDTVVMAPKPVVVHTKNGVLHNENGLAIEYPDGSGVFCLEGVWCKNLKDLEKKKKDLTHKRRKHKIKQTN